MFNSIKQDKSAQITIDFIKEPCLENVGTISIPTIFKQEISNEIDSYNLDIQHKSINEYKFYECFLHYKSCVISHYIPIYYERENNYLFGKGKNLNSVEIIFSDFIGKAIDIKKCYIIYKGQKYYAKDEKIFTTRRHLNLVNININDLIIPKDLEGNAIDMKLLKDKSYLICISVSNNEQKTIAIYSNTPTIEKKVMDVKKIIKELSESVLKVRQLLNYNSQLSFKDFKEVIFNNKYTISEYIEEYKKSDILLKRVAPYFEFFRPELNKDELKAFEIYSDFIISFPKLYQMKKIEKLQNFFIWRQYYYSQKVIENFMKTIPSDLKEDIKIKLKYTACRCLKFMLLTGYGECNENLFYFHDVNNKNQIYNDALSFNKKFIECLKESSELFLFFLELNSGSSINILTGVLTARLSMLSLDQIKKHLNLSIPNYVIRINCSTGFNGITFNETRISCINEIDILGKFQSDEELKNDEDFLFNKRYILANLMGHENFGHVKTSMNFFSFKNDFYLKNNINNFDTSDNSDDEPLSPKEYYNISIVSEECENKKEKKENLFEITEVFIENGKAIEKGESGTAFNVFLTRGNMKYMNLLKNRKADFTQIFENPKLLAEDDLTKYLNILKELSEDVELIQDEDIHISTGKCHIIHKHKHIISKDPTIAKISA